MKTFQRPTRGWLRDFRLWIVVALLAYTVFGFFGVPWILRAQISKQARAHLGREAGVRDASFNPFTLETVLRGFELKDRDGSRLAAFDELTVNLQASGLFRRAWSFREIRLVRPHLVARILADGRPAVADVFEKKPEQTPPQDAKAGGVPRLLIGLLEIDSGKIDLADESRSPRFATTLEPLSIRVSDLSTLPDESGNHAVTVGVEGGAEIRWSGRMSVDPLRFDGTVEISRMRVPRLWEYLGSAYPFDIAEGRAAAKLPYSAEKPAGQPFRAELKDASFEVTDLAVRPRDTQEDWLRLKSVEARGVGLRWPEATAQVDLVRLVEPAVRAWVAEDGTLNWMGLLAGDTSAAAAPAEQPAPPSKPWKASVAAVELTGGSVAMEDRTVSPLVKVNLEGVEARLENLTSDASAPIRAKVSSKINGSGTVSAGGTIEPKPLAADLDVDLAGLDLKPFQSYASRFARIEVLSGAAGLRGKAIYRDGGSPLARFDGRASVDNLDLANPDGERVVGWEGLGVEDVRLAIAPNRLKVRTIAFEKPFAQILIDREGKLNLAKLLVDAPTPQPAASPAADFPYDIGSITLQDAKVDYGDMSLILPFRTKIHSAKGSLKDLSSRGAAASPLVFEGKVDEYGYAKADGSLRLADPYASTDIQVLFRNIEMKGLTPYTAQFAGYAIESGRLDLNIRYKIQNRALVGVHRVTATEMTLGNKVEGAESSLPLRLAVALLKDKDGKIELDVPIEGSVDDPEFAYKKVIWSAFKRILVNVTTAPFRFLGKLLGVQGDDLEFVAFEAGRSDLLPPEQEKLGKVVEGLRTRPELHIEVGGRFDRSTDAAAIRKIKLDALIAARKEALGAGGGDDPAPVLDRAIEALYADAFSAEARDKLRQKYTTAPPPPEEGKKKGAAPPPIFDAAGFLEEARAALLAAQPVADDELLSLAGARAAAITGALTAEGALEAARVVMTAPEEVKKKKSQEGVVPCQLTLAAK